MLWFDTLLHHRSAALILPFTRAPGLTVAPSNIDGGVGAGMAPTVHTWRGDGLHGLVAFGIVAVVLHVKSACYSDKLRLEVIAVFVTLGEISEL